MWTGGSLRKTNGESDNLVETSQSWVIANPPSNSRGAMTLKGTAEWRGKGTDGTLVLDLTFTFKGQGSESGGPFPGIQIDITPFINCTTEEDTSTEFPKKSFNAKDIATALFQSFPAGNFPNNLNPDPNQLIHATAKLDGTIHGKVNDAVTTCTQELHKEKTIEFSRVFTGGESNTRWNVKAKK